jgi:hypothetical protein
MTAKTKADFEAGVRQVHREGQGVWMFRVIFPDNIPELLEAALAGDAQARRLLLVFEQFVQKVPQTNPPMLCLLCDHQFDRHLPAALVTLTAYADAPSQALMNGLCTACAGSDKLTLRIARKYKDSMIGDLRIIPDPTPPGRA